MFILVSILVLHGFNKYTENSTTLGMRILPTPDNQGLFVINYQGIHKMFCSDNHCQLIKISIYEPKINRVMGPMAMYIEKEQVNCA